MQNLQNLRKYFLSSKHRLLFVLLGFLFFTPQSLFCLSKAKLYLILNDHHSAFMEAKKAIHQDPNHRDNWQEAIEALSKMGNEKEMMNYWKRYKNRFDRNICLNHQLLENLAWGIIQKGIESNSPIVRTYSTFAAFLSHDAKGVSLILHSLQDPCAFVRIVATKLASEMKDETLNESIISILRNDQSPSVQVAAIEGIATRNREKSKSYLLAVLKSQKNTEEVKEAAIKAWGQYIENTNPNEIAYFASSRRSALRKLSCEIIGLCQLKSEVDRLNRLIEDSHPEVQIKALWALGMLKLTHPKLLELLEYKSNDLNPIIALHAAWSLTILDPKRGQKAFRSRFNESSTEIQRKTSAAIAAAGKYGFPLTLQLFLSSNDRLVKANLAIRLIQERVQTEMACDFLMQVVSDHSIRLCFDHTGVFTSISHFTRSPNTQILQDLNVQDTLIRLEILNILAIMDHPQAKNAMKNYLKKRTWGVSSIACHFLLRDENEPFLTIIEGLLQDSDDTIRIQAALVLAMVGKQKIAVPILQENYSRVPRELKERILEALGRIGSSDSILFLTDRLEEHLPTLRIVAASSLLACLYH